MRVFQLTHTFLERFTLLVKLVKSSSFLYRQISSNEASPDPKIRCKALSVLSIIALKRLISEIDDLRLKRIILRKGFRKDHNYKQKSELIKGTINVN